jgi:hypothetical protein
MLIHVLCTDGKEISQGSDLNLPPGAHTVILYAKGCYVQNGCKRTGESFLRSGIRQDNVSVKCATTFSDTLWKDKRQPGSLSVTGTSVGTAGLSI